MNKTKTILTECFFITGIFFILICPNFLTEGMFMDGLMYSAISKNLANGIGTFWNPYLSETLFPEFHEHPPLAFGIQSIFYNLFGESFYVEKIYSVLTFLIVGVFMVLIWKELKKSIATAWIPLFLWIISCLVFWGATNNILENTMAVFIILSVFIYMKSLKSHHYLFCFLSGCMLFLAFLTKGFTGLYPLSFPFFYWLFIRKNKFKNCILDTFIMFLGLTIPALILFSSHETAYMSIVKYINKQVISSLKNIQTVDTRFHIIRRFFEENITSLLFALIIVIIGISQKRIKGLFTNNDKKWIYTFLALTFSGVIPIMISLKQSAFYALTTIPYLAIALGLLIEPIIRQVFIMTEKKKQILFYLSVFVFCLAIAVNVFFCGKIGRDKDKLEDLHVILPEIPENSIISIDKSMHWEDYSLIGYFARYKNISLDNKLKHEYILSANKQLSDSSYVLVNDKTKNMFLYKR